MDFQVLWNFLVTTYNFLLDCLIKVFTYLNYLTIGIFDPKFHAWALIFVYMISFIFIMSVFFRFVNVNNIAQLIDNDSSDEAEEVLDASLNEPLDKSLEDQLDKSLDESLEKQFNKPLGGQLEDLLEDPLEGLSEDPLENPLEVPSENSLEVPLDKSLVKPLKKPLD